MMPSSAAFGLVAIIAACRRPTCRPLIEPDDMNRPGSRSLAMKSQG
jgi:hypothetical protein